MKFNMNKLILFSSIFVISMIFALSIDFAFAHPHSSQISVEEHVD